LRGLWKTISEGGGPRKTRAPSALPAPDPADPVRHLHLQKDVRPARRARLPHVHIPPWRSTLRHLQLLLHVPGKSQQARETHARKETNRNSGAAAEEKERTTVQDKNTD